MSARLDHDGFVQALIPKGSDPEALASKSAPTSAPNAGPAVTSHQRPAGDAALELAGAAVQRARDWIAINALIVDTETTGLGEAAEVVELAVIDCTGTVLLDTLVRPSAPIPAEAAAISGITDAMLEGAPTWTQIADTFRALSAGRTLVAYNAAFDTRVLEQTGRRYALPALDQIAGVGCAMQAYADFYGEWSEERGRFRWQKLSAAARQMGVPVEGAHRALADCISTLGVIRSMADDRGAGDMSPAADATVLPVSPS